MILAGYYDDTDPYEGIHHFDRLSPEKQDEHINNHERLIILENYRRAKFPKIEEFLISSKTIFFKEKKLTRKTYKKSLIY